MADQIEQYENTINKISDILSSKIIADEHGEIKEIHVLASNKRSPKQIVRDIESALMAKFGSEIDHKKVSVAQLHDENEINSSNRLKLLSVNMKLEGARAGAKVELVDGDNNIFEGFDEGAGSLINKLRLVVSATLKAIERYLNGSCSFAVEDVSLIEIAKKETVVVAVSIVTGSEEETVVGSAFIKKDVSEAAVKATLSAINRRLSKM
ncbi:MAG: hypothetical protein PWQ82_1012 [Thermosediminibacterales bacterium]|nr:hypothetical protein [Thermosediminibacterales bacterium]MDK2836198.1 hypothetical protein [Thermosediminibacterales bacterium]